MDPVTVPLPFLYTVGSALVTVAAMLAIGLLRAKRAECACDRHELQLHALELRVVTLEGSQHDMARRLNELREEVRMTREQILAALRAA